MNPESEMYRKGVTWSSGPDGIDEGGGGDDVLVHDRPTECPAWLALSHPGISCVVTALLLGWTLLATCLSRAPPALRWLEVTLALAPLLIPTAGLFVVVALQLDGRFITEANAPALLLVPPTVAVLGSAGFALVGFALVWWRIRSRAHIDHPPSRAAVAWIAAALVLLLGSMLSLGYSQVGDETRTRNLSLAWSRLILIARAQSEFRERYGRYGSGEELAAERLVPERVVSPWAGYRIERVWAGKSAPRLTWAAAAVAMTPDATWRLHQQVALNHGAIFWFKDDSSPLEITEDCDVTDRNAFCQSR